MGNKIGTEFWRLPKVKKVSGLSKSNIYGKIKKGQFPAPVSLGERCSAWISTEVLAWQEDRIAERDKNLCGI